MHPIAKAWAGIFSFPLLVKELQQEGGAGNKGQVSLEDWLDLTH